MRKKSETKRQEILQAADEVFRKTGYERASMDEISAQVGCSKATLYSHFASKEELLYVVLTETTDPAFRATYAALKPGTPLRPTLQQFGEQLLRLLYSPELQSLRRLVIAEAGRSDIGKRCYELGPAQSIAAVTEFLRDAMAESQIRKCDPRVAAMHLHGLLEAEWIYPILFQTLSCPSREQIRKTVDNAVTVFLSAYAPRDSVARSGTAGAGKVSSAFNRTRHDMPRRVAKS
ncbi:MAG: TetR/AcrR family transcriptional regulator [Steroidobacteraceae bacterium]|nr:TetR/AcrR family transcriptional regulator [Steroidobacteraceae bacterium]